MNKFDIVLTIPIGFTEQMPGKAWVDLSSEKFHINSSELSMSKGVFKKIDEGDLYREMEQISMKLIEDFSF